MWPSARLTDLLGIEHPIIQAPMLGSATPDLAAAVSNAGGMGSLGFGAGTVEAVEQALAAMRARTNAPFNLNFFMPDGPPQTPAARAAMRERLAPFYHDLGAGDVPDPPTQPPRTGIAADLVDLLLRERPAVVSFHFGLPGEDVVRRLRGTGTRVIATATTVAEARALEAGGVDAIIAQGWEAGGHRGSHRRTLPGDGVGTMALVPQVVDAVRVPVIAAGGIGDGRGIAAAFALGACGVQMGTAFLSCPEAATDERRRVLLRQATDTDTMVTDAVSGRSARAVRSRYAEVMAPFAGQMAPYPDMYAFSGPLEEASMGRADEIASFHLYGQAAALNREIPAGDLLRALVGEAMERMTRLAGW